MSAIHSLDSEPRTVSSPFAQSPRRGIPAWLKLIQEAVESADYGTVQIKVHAGEVVQIETTRKIRVPAPSSRPLSNPTALAEESPSKH